jgi:hypothetical protein
VATSTKCPIPSHAVERAVAARNVAVDTKGQRSHLRDALKQQLVPQLSCPENKPNINQCSPLEVNRHFGGTCHLHAHGGRISRTRYQFESRLQAEPSGCRTFFLSWKTKLTAVRTQGPTGRKLSSLARWTTSCYCNTFVTHCLPGHATGREAGPFSTSLHWGGALGTAYVYLVVAVECKIFRSCGAT